MVEAYILITTTMEKVREVSEKIEDFENVSDVRVVTGPFDIVVFAQAEDLSTLTSTVIEGIRSIDGVVSTDTAVVVE